MELTLIATAISACLAVGTAAVTAVNTHHRVKLIPRTKVDLIKEQRVLGQYLLREVEMLAAQSDNVSKNQASLVLNQLAILAGTAQLRYFFRRSFDDSIESAYIALELQDLVDSKYLNLLGELVEKTIQYMIEPNRTNLMSMNQSLEMRILARQFRHYSMSSHEFKRKKRRS